MSARGCGRMHRRRPHGQMQGGEQAQADGQVRAEGRARVHMAFTRDEGGFTTPAAAIALLVVCALLFVCLHAFSVGTRSGQVQYVADAGALAADNVVAEFVTAGQVVDAVLLSCSLLSLGLYAVAAVVAFIPEGAIVSTDIVEVAERVDSMRKKFAKSATKGLNAVQDVLPALIAVRAASCIDANAQASGIDYVGAAIAFPAEGVEVDLASTDALDEATETIADSTEDISLEADELQQTQDELDIIKEEAWLVDCGDADMTMRERAAKLAGLSGASNPMYSSVDSWSFSVPLARAKAYYKARYAAEAGASYDGDPDEVAESVARKRFYKYALAEVSEGSVTTSASGLELPSFHYLARNTAQIRETELYTESIYPVSSDEDGVLTIHAYTGCPAYQAGTAAGTASVADEENGLVEECETCQFSVTTLGRVPAASTSISNGFEFYYRELVDLAEQYREYVLDCDESTEYLQEQAESIAGLISEAVAELKATRYSPQPPGRYGCVCVVYAPSTGTADVPFLGEVAGTPARFAISAATLAADEADSEGDAIADIAYGLLPSGSSGSSVLHVALSAWSSLLKAYTHGTDGIGDAFETLLGAVPVVGTSLSGMAEELFSDALTSVGLQPADMNVYKPVVVNSSHVLDRDGGSLAKTLLAAKDAAEVYGEASVGSVQTLVDQLESVTGLSSVLSGDGLVVATLPLSSLGSGFADVDITVSAPSNLSTLLDEAIASLAELAVAGAS